MMTSSIPPLSFLLPSNIGQSRISFGDWKIKEEEKEVHGTEQQIENSSNNIEI